MKKYLLFILFFANVHLNAQAPAKFFTRFGGYGHDIGYSVIQTLNGQYAVAGSTGSFGNGNSDVYLAFVDSMGWVRWEKSYGGFNNDIGKSIIQLADSGFVIAGYTNSFGAGGYDMFVVRTDKAGTLIWQKTFGGLDWDFANAVKTTSLGDSLIIAGNTYSFGYGKSDAYIVKTDLNGIFQWQKTYGGAEDDEFKSFVLTYNNQYAFAGTTKSMGDVKGDCWLLKTGLNGDSVLSVKYGNSYKQFINDIKEHPVTKNFYLCGGYDKLGLDSTSAILLCLDQNGTFQFEDIFSYREQIDEQFVSNAYFKNNQFLYIRKSIYSNTDKRLQPMVSQFDNNNYVAATKYGSTDDDELFCISNTKNKGFICVGYTKGFGSNLSDVFLLKLDSNSIIGAPNIISVNDISEHVKKLNVFPTIITNEVNLDYEEFDLNTNLILSDCYGRILFQEKITKPRTTFSTGNLNAGVYFVTVTENNYSRTFKIIKSN